MIIRKYIYFTIEKGFRFPLYKAKMDLLFRGTVRVSLPGSSRAVFFNVASSAAEQNSLLYSAGTQLVISF